MESAGKRKRSSKVILGEAAAKTKRENEKEPTPLQNLLDIEKQLDQMFEVEKTYLSVADRHSWGLIVLGFKIGSDESLYEIWFRIAKKFLWYNVYPLNFKDGRWKTF